MNNNPYNSSILFLCNYYRVHPMSVPTLDSFKYWEPYFAYQKNIISLSKYNIFYKKNNHETR